MICLRMACKKSSNELALSHSNLFSILSLLCIFLVLISAPSFSKADTGGMHLSSVLSFANPGTPSNALTYFFSGCFTCQLPAPYPPSLCGMTDYLFSSSYLYVVGGNGVTAFTTSIGSTYTIMSGRTGFSPALISAIPRIYTLPGGNAFSTTYPAPCTFTIGSTSCNTYSGTSNVPTFAISTASWESISTAPTPTMWITGYDSNNNGLLTWTQDAMSFQPPVTISPGSGCFSILTITSLSTTFIGCANVLINMPTTNNPLAAGFSPSKVNSATIGAGKIKTLVFLPPYIYVGTDVGLIFALDISVLSSVVIKNVLFVPVPPGINLSQGLNDVFVDTSTPYPVMFFAAASSSIIRINVNPLNYFSFASTPSANETMIWIKPTNTSDPNSPLALLSASNPSESSQNTYDNQLYVTLRTDCSIYSCNNCSTDSAYCGYCLTTGTCTQSFQCPTSSSWLRQFICPALTGISPKSSSLGGNINVTITSLSFDSSNPQLYQCLWNGLSHSFSQAPLLVTPTTAICLAPPWPYSEQVTLGIDYASRQWISSANFTYYDCTLLSCSQCSSPIYQSGCGWCFGTSTCTSIGSCSQSSPSAEFQIGSCPAVTSIDPPSGSIRGTTTLNVTVSNFPYNSARSGYSCSFGSYGNSTATPNFHDSNYIYSFTCNTPASSLSSGEVVTPLYIGGTGNILYTPTSKPLDLYNCTGIGAQCGQCTGFPECTWCSSGSNSSYLCDYATGRAPNSQCSIPNLKCAIISSVNPPSLQYFEASDYPLTVSGSNFVSVPTSCLFFLSSSPTTTPATVVSSSTVTCSTPPGMAQGSYDLVLSFANSFTNSIPFSVYDCSTQYTCSNCLSPGNIACNWCADLSSLTCSNTTFPLCTHQISAASGTCPAILSTNPSAIPLLSASNITLSGPLYLDATEIESGQILCGFGKSTSLPPDISTTAVYDDTNGNNNTITCPNITPNATGATNLFLYLPASSTLYAAPFTINVVDCTQLSDCPTCIASGCVLCFGQCMPTSGCTLGAGQKVCPTITSFQPDYASVIGCDSVTVVGENFLYYPSGASCSTGSGMRRSLIGGSGEESMRWENENQIFHDEDLALKLYKNASAHQWINLSNRLRGYDASIIGRSNEVSNLQSKSDNLEVSTQSKQYTYQESQEFILDAEVSTLYSSSSSLSSSSSSNTIRSAAGPCSTVTSNYACLWSKTICTAGSSLSDSEVSCFTPAVGGPTSLTLDLYIGQNLYASSSQPISFYSCPIMSGPECNPACSSGPNNHCGWCLGAGRCGPQFNCSSIWQAQCVSLGLSFDTSKPQGGEILTVTMSSPLPSVAEESQVQCLFGGNYFIPATFIQSSASNGSISQISCNVPSSPSGGAYKSSFNVLYSGEKYAVTTAFDYVNCGASTKCSTCSNTAGCGWCYSSNKCTLKQDCASSSKWSTIACPPNVVAIAVGTSLGVFFFILLVILLIILARKAMKSKDDLALDMKEPDYDAIAWGTDIDSQFRAGDYDRSILLASLARRDFLLQTALSFVCPATEQDSLAKALVFVANYHGLATEMIQTVIRAEVQYCLDENTLFRSNSMASKMYKFHSRIVGIKYLFHCVARVIVELEILGRRMDASDSKSQEVSLLAVSMELDQTKELSDDMDTDTNLLQLQLICQKILKVLIKSSLHNIPGALLKIFAEIDLSVSSKFPGSIDAVYKGLGGLYFLRFICPAITAPHVYGLLENAPNPTTQRQLVLISKVLQSIANMQPPGNKEEYMNVLTSFISSSIPRIKKFYDNLRMASINEGSEYDREIQVPESVLQNGLDATVVLLVDLKQKITEWIPKSQLDEMQRQELEAILASCLAAIKKVPKKGAARRETGAGKKATSKAAKA